MILGVVGCWAAALAAGGVAFVDGTYVSGVGGQPWPRGWLGCGWLAERGYVGGVRAPEFSTCPVLVLADSSGGRGRRILHEGAMAVFPPLACDSV